MINKNIKKTLECCTAYGLFTCTCCQQKSLKLCKGINLKDVLKLINQYEAEIERLQSDRDVWQTGYVSMEAKVWELSRQLNTAKSDAIKDFAEKVKEETYHYYDSDIDELAKEMRVN